MPEPRRTVNPLTRAFDKRRKLFAPLKFLITSRPEVPIARVFNASPVIGVSGRHSLDDEPSSIEDVGYFLSAKFDEIQQTHPLSRHIPHDWPSPAAKASLVQKSSGQFIYPATVIRFISSPRHNPVHRLDIVLRLRPLLGESPFAELDALYRHILQSCYEIELALRIIGICLLSTQDMDTPWNTTYTFPQEIMAPKKIESVLRILPGDVQRVLEDLGSLIEYRGDYEKLRILHASLFDFLSDPTRSLDLPFDLESIHTDVAIWCIRLDRHEDYNPDSHYDHYFYCEFIVFQLLVSSREICLSEPC